MSVETVVFTEDHPSLQGEWVYDSASGGLRSNVITHSQNTTLIIDPFQGEAAGSSAVKVTLQARVSSEPNYDKLRVTANGASEVYSGEVDWFDISEVLSSGEVITLEYFKDTSGDKGEDAAFIRRLEFAYGTEVANPVTSDNLEGDWYYDPSNLAFRSKDIGDSESSIALLDIASFGIDDAVLAILEVRASMEKNADKLLIGHNGPDLVVTGDSGWVKVPVNIPDDGIIRLSYIKDSSVSTYEDAAYIKTVYVADGGAEAVPVSMFSLNLGVPYLGYYPYASPRIPYPSAIKADGRSLVSSTVDLVSYLGVIDQIDGSGANGTPTGGVSVPARMGVIAGTVLDIQAQPVSRRVRVHERATGRIVRETWSDADGKYRFTDLDPRRAFYVMAFDHTLQQNAVVSDNVHSEVEDSP
mgnify:FL=1|tara:strand:+ start:354 stop:1592 length:1239 start_codon:yes stop_codon:yes gene_type:complete